MAPTLIVLALLALGVVVIAFATRRSPGRPAPAQGDQDTAWSEPGGPVDATAPGPAPAGPTGPSRSAPSPSVPLPASDPRS